MRRTPGSVFIQMCGGIRAASASTEVVAFAWGKRHHETRVSSSVAPKGRVKAFTQNQPLSTASSLTKRALLAHLFMSSPHFKRSVATAALPPSA